MPDIIIPVIDKDTWIISDTHFRHKNIIKFCNRPMGHDRQMQQNWHELVRPEDTILHLGDVLVWYGPERVAAEAIVRSLPGRKLLIRGNHDIVEVGKKRLSNDDENSYFESLGFEVIPEFIQEFAPNRVLFSHYPDSTRTHAATGHQEWDINIHGHIHTSGYDPQYDRNLDYRNVSIEVMDYKPVRLAEILNGKYESIIAAKINKHD